MNQWMNEKLQQVVPYHAAHITTGIKLDANENAYGVVAAIREHMAAYMLNMPVHRYPDTDSSELVAAIATHYGVVPQQVVVGVGSDQLIDCILRATLNPGDQVVCPDPSFSMYGLTVKNNDGMCRYIPLREDFSYDVAQWLQVVEEVQPKVLFICNPNNPTGSCMTPEEIKQILAVAKGLVIVDEAYGEFCDHSMIPFVDTYSNLLVLRTFSKAYGLAGARVGYGVGNEEIIDAINRIKPPYNLNIFAQEIGRWVMTHHQLFAPSIACIKQEREKLFLACNQLGLRTYPSEANFLWIESDYPLQEWLANEQIYIRKMFYQNKAYYRVTVGNEAENNALLAVLKAHIGGGKNA